MWSAAAPPPCTTTTSAPASTSDWMSVAARVMSASSAPPSLMTYLSERIQARELESGGFVPSGRDVEALDGISRTSLDQVVDGGDDDEVVGARGDRQADV